MTPRLYVGTGGFSVWYSNDLGQTFDRLWGSAGLYSETRVWALNTAAGLRSLTVALFVAACGMPPLFGLVVGSKPDDVALNLFNPMVGAANFGMPHHGHSADSGYLVALLVIALLITVIADRMLFSHESASRSQRAKARREAPEPVSPEVQVTRVANG